MNEKHIETQKKIEILTKDIGDLGKKYEIPIEKMDNFKLDVFKTFNKFFKETP